MNIPSSNQYPVTVFVQYTLLLFDACVNSFSSFAKPRPVDLLTLYVWVSLRFNLQIIITLVLLYSSVYSSSVQDFCLIVALTILLINFFATYIFQVNCIIFLSEILSNFHRSDMSMYEENYGTRFFLVSGRLDPIALCQISHDSRSMRFVHHSQHKSSHMAYNSTLVSSFRALLDQRIPLPLLCSQNRYISNLILIKFFFY